MTLTATTTAVSAWAEMRKAHELWRHQRELECALKDIKRDLDDRSATGELADKYLDECFGRAAAVIGSSSSKWARIHERSLENSSAQEEKPWESMVVCVLPAGRAENKGAWCEASLRVAG